MDENIHTYNLKAVVLETGLKPVTIRAWERRYGLPDPDRTPGGHRLYSQRDIDILKWLIARQKEGVSISRAVALWRNLEEEGEDPIEPEPARALAPIQPMPDSGNDLIATLRQEWIDACLTFDQKRVDHVMNQAFSRFASEIVCIELLQKGLAEIGMGWYEQNITVQQEHFASSQAQRRLEMLIAAKSPPTRQERILVGCAAKDTHTFSPLLLTFILGRYGWDVVYLGADVPVGHLAETVAVAKPDLVIFTAQQLHTAASLLNVSDLFNKQNIAFAYGGLAFLRIPELQEKIRGHYLGDELLKAPENVQEIFSGKPEPSEELQISADYIEARKDYEQYRSSIEVELWESIPETDGNKFLPELLSEVNMHFGRDINAALKFGDINLLNPNIEWLKTLIANHGWDSLWLNIYLSSYQKAVSKFLDADHPLLVWLGSRD